MKKTSKAQQGFTLIELLIVVAIIGILAAIAIPAYNQYRITSANSACLSDTRSFATVYMAAFYNGDTGAALPAYEDVTAAQATTGRERACNSVNPDIATADEITFTGDPLDPGDTSQPYVVQLQ